MSPLVLFAVVTAAVAVANVLSTLFLVVLTVAMEVLVGP